MRPDLIYEINLDINESSNNWIFNEAIKIVITKDSGARIDFKVKLLDKEKMVMYKGFCANLKNTKIHGIYFASDNDFRNYPKLELEKQKKVIKDKHESVIGVISVIRLLDWKYMSDNCFINKNKNKNKNKNRYYKTALQ